MVAQISQCSDKRGCIKKEPSGFAGRLSNFTFVRLFLMTGRGGFLRIRR
jgi:hypothetical protein